MRLKGLPDVPEALPAYDATQGGRLKTLTVKDLSLAVPMVGGGIESMVPDERMPVRGQSVRGQLRFWWRTFQDCVDVDELRERENRIWGSTEGASKVSVDVKVIEAPKKITYTEENPAGLPKYVLFPLDNTRDVDRFTLLSGGKFDLSLSYDPAECGEDVEKSVKLWLLFGGIGARTRRGMGSLYSPHWPGWKSAEEIIKWLKAIIPADSKRSRPWPSLIGAKVLPEPVAIGPKGILGPWKDWIDRYRNFRQNRNPDHRNRPFGSSKWPEPKAIRTLEMTRGFDAGAFFPRAAFGLPINFHFPRNHLYQNSAEMTFLLEGNASDRWASPVILKGFQLDSKKGVLICLKLNSPLPDGFCVKKPDGSHEELPDAAAPLRNHELRNSEPLNHQDPYTALFRCMSDKPPITLGGPK